MISVIQDNTDQLSESNHKFENAFTYMAENVSNVNIAVEEIAQGSTSQAQETAFEGLKDEVGEVSDVSKNISIQTEKIEELREQVSNVVEQLAAIAQENAASTEETSATMQTLSEAVDENQNEVKLLVELSNILSEQTSKFKF